MFDCFPFVDCFVEKRLLQSGLFFAMGDVSRALMLLEESSQSIMESLHFSMDEGSSLMTEEHHALSNEGSVTDVPAIDIPPVSEPNPMDVSQPQSGREGAMTEPVPTASGELSRQMSQTESQASAFTSRYLLEVETIVEKALVAYNAALLRGVNAPATFQYPIKMMEAFVHHLRRRKVRVDKSQLPNARNAEDNPYHNIPYNSHPEFIPYDIYMYPVLAWSQLLVAESENQLLAYSFDHTLTKVQQGEVVTNPLPHSEDEDGVEEVASLSSMQKALTTSESSKQHVEELHRLVQRALSVIEACRFVNQVHSNSIAELENPSIHQQVQYEEDIEQALQSLSVLDYNANPTTTSTNIAGESTASATSNTSAIEAVDVSLMKDQVRNFKSYLDLDNTEFVNKNVSFAALKILKNHNIDLNPVTGKLMEVDLNPTRASTTAKGGSRKNKKKSTASRASTATTDGLGDALTAAQKAVDAMGLPIAEAANASIAENNIVQYKASTQDKVSLRSDFNPLVEYFGRDEISGYIEWSVANIGGISFGFLGTSVGGSEDVISYIESGLPPKQDDDEDEAKDGHKGGPRTPKPPPVSFIQNAPSKEFLQEVRQRLVDIDQKSAALLQHRYPLAYTSIYVMSPTSGGEKGGDNDLEGPTFPVESYPGRALEHHCIVLLLLIKISTQLHCKAETGLHLQHFYNMASYLYKLRAFVTEATIYMAFAHRYTMEYAEWCADAMLSEREYVDYAYRKMFPHAKKYYQLTKTIGDLQVRKDALKKLINMYTLIGRTISNVGNDSSSVVSSVMSVTSTNMADLMKFDDASIAHYEDHDPDWVKKYGKLRALQFMKEMKSLSTSSNSDAAVASNAVSVGNKLQ